MIDHRPRADVALSPATETPLLCTVTSAGTLLGYVAIDSTVAGRAQGGLRLLPDVDEVELRGLAEAMTLKYGLLGLPQGGAKAGVRGDPEAPAAERQARLAAFGRAIAPLLRRGVYVPGTDMGTTPADIAVLLRAAGVRRPRRQPATFDSGRATALTVFAGVRQVMRRRGRSLAGRTIAIEGFGMVGRPLAEWLVDSGARVVAISTSRGALYDPDGLDVLQLARLARTAGSAVVDQAPVATRLPAAALLELPVDVLCPCARHGSIHAGNVDRVAATAIVPGANTPVTRPAEAALAARGVVCLPDFVTNAGGVLGGTMAFAGIAPARIDGFLEQAMAACVERLLDEAGRRGVTPRAVAEPVARRRHARVRQAAEQPSPVSQVFAAALAAYRRGWLPRRVVAPLAERYFARHQAALLADLRAGDG